MKQLRTIRPHPTDATLALVELTRGYWAVIDAADAADVGRFNWFATSEKGAKIYAARTTPGSGREYLHQFVAALAGISIDQHVDHRNTNTFDCRRSNLRSATNAQNHWNTGARSDNISGVKGVFWDSRDRKWRAEIRVNRRKIYLGYFADLQDAVEARRIATAEYHGEFGRDN